METVPSALAFAEWLLRIESFERLVRLGAVSSFGLALILGAIHMRQRILSGESAFELRKLLLFWRQHPATLARLSHVFYVAGTLLVVAQLALTVALPQAGIPAMMSLGLVALVTSAVLAVGFDREKLPAFNFATSSLAWLVLVLIPLLEAQGPVAQQRTQLTSLGRFHIVAAIVAQSLFVLGCATSCIYIFLHRRLRQKRLIVGAGFPSLDTLDRFVDRAHVLGLLVMTMSLMAGLAMTYQGYVLGGDALVKLSWAFGVWIWYVTAIFGRARWGWRGYRGAIVSVIGGGLLGLALFGTVWGT